jgi:hypothetical protein
MCCCLPYSSKPSLQAAGSKGQHTLLFNMFSEQKMHACSTLEHVRTAQLLICLVNTAPSNVSDQGPSGCEPSKHGGCLNEEAAGMLACL